MSCSNRRRFSSGWRCLCHGRGSICCSITASWRRTPRGGPKWWRGRRVGGAAPAAGAESNAAAATSPGPAGRRWADLMRRAFEVDVLACPRCGGRLRLVALLEVSTVTARILRHLGLPSEVPAARPARAPPLSSGDESCWAVIVPPAAVVAPAKREPAHHLRASALVAVAAGGLYWSVASRAVTGHQRPSRGRCGGHLPCGRGRIFGESRRGGPITPVPLPRRPVHRAYRLIQLSRADT